jgi:hypothetical protein
MEVAFTVTGPEVSKHKQEAGPLGVGSQLRMIEYQVAS